MTMPPIPTPVDPLDRLLAALYARLSGDTTLRALLGTKTGSRPLLGVYDGAPEGVLYPYIDLGEAIATPDNAHREFGAEVVVTLHVWLKARSYDQGHKIVARLRALLDHQPLTVDGPHVVSVRHEQTLTLRDPNPELRHLPVRFRITTEQEN